MFMENEYINNFTDEEQRICEGCSASGLLGGGKLLHCLLATVERNTGKVPTDGQAKISSIDITRVPKDCRNGYLQVGELPLRRQDCL
jgi:hypothetical protein